MFSEKQSLIEKKGSPFYGSYKEKNSVLEEIHAQNKKKQRQLLIVSIVVLTLALLGIAITLAITLPPLLEKNANRKLDPPNPVNLTISSTSSLERYEHAAVSSESPICSDIGRQIMNSMNGSAVDAAIGVALCIGVVCPQSSGLGGGMFMTIYSNKTMYTLNARERAPEGFDEEGYLHDHSALLTRGLAVAIPGEITGLWMAHQKFGLTPWSDLVKFASDLATNGFVVSEPLAASLKKHTGILTSDPALQSEFIDPETGEPWLEGDVITRPRLARTLQSLGNIRDFYNETLASQIVQELTEHGGAITSADLSGYKADWVDPIVVKYRNNLTMFSLPFPSSGPVVALALGILDGYGKVHADATQVQNGIDHHRFVEVLKFAETHRAQISDPNFDQSGDLDALLDKMLSEKYADELRGKIGDYKTSTDPEYYGAVYSNDEESGTAHISIIGPNGDAVSLTTTINSGFGAGFMGNTTGIIYNNEISDFSFPNKSGAYGLPTNPQNYVQPGKQPSSSMSPLIFLNPSGEPVLATGGAGGVNIVPAVISATWGSLYRSMDIKAAIDYPRFTVSFNETAEVFYEYGLPSYLINDLERKGQRTRRVPVGKYIANVNSVCMTKNSKVILANADHRKKGGSAGF